MQAALPINLVPAVTTVMQPVKSLDEVLASAAPPQSLKARIAAGLTALAGLRDFLPPTQARNVTDLIRNSEERDFFIDKMIELAALVKTIPVTFEGREAEDPICHLHYFGGSYDGYLIEKDIGDPEEPEDTSQHQAWGWGRFNHMPDGAETGYMSLPEMFSSPIIELDFHFEPTPLSKIIGKYQPAPEPEPEVNRQAEFMAQESAGAGAGYQPGAIIVSSWGHEQTNIDFYQVTKRSGETITVIPLAAIKTRANDRSGLPDMRGTSVPGDPITGAKPIRRKLTYLSGRAYTKIDYGSAKLWNGTPQQWTDYA